MKSMLLLLALSILPTNDAVVDRVDLVEVNHVYDRRGRHCYDQMLFYDWCGTDYQVRSHRLMKAGECRPIRDFRRGDWAAVFVAGELLREVRAANHRETWTQHDPEQTERDKLPKHLRRGLTLETIPEPIVLDSPVCDDPDQMLAE